MRHALFEYEPLAAVFERSGIGEGGGDAITLCLALTLVDSPNLLTERGALIVDGRENRHLAPGVVICFRSRPNALPYCRTAALVSGTYALPPNTQLTLEEVLKPPWTATLRCFAFCTGTRTRTASSVSTGATPLATPRPATPSRPPTSRSTPAAARARGLLIPSTLVPASLSTPSTTRPMRPSSARSPVAASSSSPSLITCRLAQRPRPR